MSMGLAEPKPRVRKSARTDSRKPARKDGRIKATLLLGESLDFRLTTVAASQKLDRSQLAALLLDQGLRKYALDAALRQFADGARDTQELGPSDRAKPDGTVIGGDPTA